MTPQVLRELGIRATTIRDRWEALLRIEPISGPLANPDALVHLIPDSLGSIFQRLREPLLEPVDVRTARANTLPACNCGNNPYRAFFIAGEQAVLETMVLLQAELGALARSESDLARAIYAVRSLAREEIDAFCGMCLHRSIARHCRHVPATAV